MPGRINAVYTRGSIAGTMLKTAVAMLAGALAMSGYNLADTYFVGQLGCDPLAAMGFSFPVIMLIGCVFHGLGAGVMTTAAQSLGGGKNARAARLVSAGFLLIAVVAILLAILGMTTANAAFARFGASGRALDEVCGYMNIWYFGCVTAALSMAGNNVLVGVGDSRFASAMMILGMVINVGLDPVLIFGWGPVLAMGIRGAALATIVSQAVVTVAMLVLLSRRHRLSAVVSAGEQTAGRQRRSDRRRAAFAAIGCRAVQVGGVGSGRDRQSPLVLVSCQSRVYSKNCG